jgi:hypothetical protein
MEQENRTGIQSLPPELLDEIFSLLSQPSPSIQRLQYQPFHDLTHSTILDLKSISHVSQRWRQAILPLLFQHVRMILPLDNIQSKWPTELEDFLTFVLKNTLESKIHSFTLVVQDHQPIRTYYDLDKLPDAPDKHWPHLFNTINPFRLTIIAPPPILGYLTDLSVDIDNVADFHMPYHILSLTQCSTSHPTENRNEDLSITETALLRVRPWESLLLNEGSFIRTYSTAYYGRDVRNPPSILPSLVQDQASRKGLQTIKSVSYVALYPASVHVISLSDLFAHIQSLHIQLVPQHDPFPDQLQHGVAAFMAMEMQRLWCYRSLIRASINACDDGTLALREISCGDAAVGPVWKDTVQHTADYFPGYWINDPLREGVLVRGLGVRGRDSEFLRYIGW